MLIGEICRYGYIPTWEEEMKGHENPYGIDSAGCSHRPETVYSFQSAVAFTTLLLSLVVIASGVISHRQRSLHLSSDNHICPLP